MVALIRLGVLLIWGFQIMKYKILGLSSTNVLSVHTHTQKQEGQYTFRCSKLLLLIKSKIKLITKQQLKRVMTWLLKNS